MAINKVERKILLLILFAGIFIHVSAQSCMKKDMAESRHIIEVLSSDSLKGRLAGSDNDKKTSDFIISLFRKNKLIPFFKDSFRYSFLFLQDSVQYTSSDIAGVVNNSADSSIAFIAHYDHIGMGGPKSKSLTNQKIHPGADDNASGITALILLSEKLKRRTYKKYNYLFIATGAHEPGLWGAKFFADSCIPGSLKIKCVINLDMIGRLDTQTKILNYAISKPSFLPEPVFTGYSNDSLKPVKRTLPAGDHTPFQDKGLPVLYLTTGDHEDYHKTTDTAEKINYYGILQIVGFIEYLIKN